MIPNCVTFQTGMDALNIANVREKASSIATYNFSIFYTNIQHNKETRFLFIRQELQTKVFQQGFAKKTSIKSFSICFKHIKI